MRRSVMNRAREQLYRQSRRRQWLMLVTCLACIVVFITTSMLILPAITLESSTETLNCEDSIHTHTENCYDTEGSLICGYADFAVHTHDSGCYDQNGNLICPLPEIQLHTHTDECYAPIESEGETHVHTEACYDAQQGQLVCGQETERELICGKDEIILHSHEESCYGENGGLICGQLQIEEHIHSLECYGESAGEPESTAADGESAGEPESTAADGESAGEPESTAADGESAGEPESSAVDAEAAGDWEKALADVELTGIWADDLVAIAESQLGYQESVIYYVPGEDGETVNGYTLYGDWYGDAYGDWCAMFVSFCLNNAGIPAEAVPRESDVSRWIELLSGQSEDDGDNGLYVEAGDYLPVSGDLAFLDTDGDGQADRVGIVAECGEGQIRIIEGDLENRVQNRICSLEDGMIAGWAVLPVNPAGLDLLSLSLTDDDSGELIDEFYLWLWASLQKDSGEVDPIEVKQLPKWAGSGWASSGITDVRRYTDADANETYYLIPIKYFEENYGAYGYSFDPENPGECPFQYAPDANYSEVNLIQASYVQADGEWYVRIQDKTAGTGATPPRSNIYYFFLPAPTTEFYLWLQAYRIDSGGRTKEEIFMHPANWEDGRFVDFGVTDVLTYSSEAETYYLIPIHYFTENYGNKKYGYSFDPENPGECPFKYAPDANYSETGLIQASYVQAGSNWYVQIQDKTENTTPPRSNIYYEYYSIVTDTANHMGSVINLFDYWTTDKDDSDAVNGVEENGVNAGHTLKFGRNVSDEEKYGKWNVYTGAYAGVYPGIVKNKLEDGYPVLSGKAEVFSPSTATVNLDTEESLAYLFDPLFDPEITSGYKEVHRNVSGLLQVDAHGYYYYNSQENFAEYNEDTNSFILYNTGGVKSVGKSPNGQFFPFNTIREAANVNSENAVINHYFGMTLTTRFIQQYGGHTTATKDTDTVFSFSGDDDVWIFIDDVLVADLGGIHDAAKVEINFATGKVTVSKTSDPSKDSSQDFEEQTTTTLKDAFVAAGEEYNVEWNVNTFADNSYHTLRFYYLERGNTDSNLWLKYNLSTVMENSIFKVNQYGDPVPGAVFAVYAADEDYQMLNDLNGGSVNLGEDDISYDLNPNSPSYGSILGKGSTDGTIAKALYTGTTDNEGEMVFVDEDNMPYTLSELEDMFGDHFLLREIVMPEGYRKVSDEVKLRIANHQVLLCDNTYESGIYAAPNLLITAPNDIILASNPDNLNDENSDTAQNVIHYYDANGNENGIVFAVVLKYIGPENSEKNLGIEANWAPLYGTDKVGFTVVNVGNFSGDFIAAVIDTAKRYVESDNVFSLSTSGQMQGILNGLPGDISTYYYMLGSAEKAKTQYTVAYYWSSADSLDNATSENTYRIDADKETAGDDYEFNRNFGSTISVPNLLNRLFVQKLDEDGNLVNGAVFAMYQVEEDEYQIEEDEDEADSSRIYYIATDGTRIYLEPDEDGDNQGEATIIKSEDESNKLVSGTYKIDSKTGKITVTGQITMTDETETVNYEIDAMPYGIGEKRIAVTSDRTTDKNIGENGSSYFSNMPNGKYYVREIAAPEGYELNSTEVMVLVDDAAVYANAGTAGDGVTVGRGSGYVVSTLDQFASKGDINNTLTWIYQMMRVSGESKTFPDFSSDEVSSWGYLVENRNGSLTTLDEASKLKIYLQYDANAESEGNALFNYGLNTDRYEKMGKDPTTIQRRLYTDVGWSYYEIYQDSRWALGYSDVSNEIYFSKHRKEGAGYDILTDDGSETGDPMEIAHLFSRATYIQVTDQRISNLEIGKTVINPTASEDEPDQTSFTFTVNLFSGYTEKQEPVPLTGEYAYTVYDVSVNEEGETVRDVAEHTVGEKTVKYAGSFTADSSDAFTLTLTDKQVVVIENLPYGTSYTITETDNPIYSTSYAVNGGQENPGTAASGQLIWALEGGTLNNTAVVSFTNTYLPPVDLTIRKTDAISGKALAGAEFKLSRTVEGVCEYYGENGQWGRGTEEGNQATLITGEDGLIKLTGLTDGDYTLTETAAPEGYQITSDGVVRFTVTRRSIPEDDSIRKDVDYDGSGQINAYVLTVKNSMGYVLPNTGGAGTLPYTIGGALIIGTGFLYGGYLRRKRER